jgi:hypothetical protein
VAVVQHGRQVHHSYLHHIADNDPYRSQCGTLYGGYTTGHYFAIIASGQRIAERKVLL